MNVRKTKVTETEITEINTEDMREEEMDEILCELDRDGNEDDETLFECQNEYDKIEYTPTPLQQGYRAWGARMKNEALYGIDPTIEVNLVEDLVFTCLQHDLAVCAQI